jgi:hypothetical protein
LRRAAPAASTCNDPANATDKAVTINFLADLVGEISLEDDFRWRSVSQSHCRPLFIDAHRLTSIFHVDPDCQATISGLTRQRISLGGGRRHLDESPQR